MVSDVEFIIIVSFTDYAPRCYRLKKDHVKIGRGRSNHLTLDNPAISSSHCEFAKNVDTGRWNFRDLGSTNGSKSNGHQVDSKPVPVSDGDQLLLGEEVKLLFCEVRDFQDFAEVRDDDPDLEVNPVAAAMARQVREDQDGGQTVRLGNTES